MSLFQPSVLNAYLKAQDKDAVSKAYTKYVAYFHNAEIQNNINNSKEEQYQEGFLIELFVSVFGFTLNPKPNFDLTTEFKNERGGKKADAAILKNGKAIAVIELKSTRTKDLEKIRQQAFDYKANHTGCIYVITSSFEKLRFYINDAVEYEEFNLYNLSEERFSLLYLCIQRENLISNLPLNIKNESIVEEEKITKHFYNDYSLFKAELYQNLIENNANDMAVASATYTTDTDRTIKNIKLSLFKTSQKLIDRFLFIFFAEDRGLLSPNTTIGILNDWVKLAELDVHIPLYDRFKMFFNYLDQGRQRTEKVSEVFAYNGGLFKPDSIIENLKIADDLLYRHAKKLSSYDFNSQVDVNVLGHIFENSLTENENLSAEIEGKKIDNRKTKKKKDGVFYTPRYITKFMVNATLGRLCSDRKAALELIDGEYKKESKGRKKTTLKSLKHILDEYREWLLNIKIIDPACGSGAFLNEALDFLIKEHHYIDELEAALFGGGLVFRSIENTILENNIYGVDINEESVEIAKLSLWLRSAQPRRKLNNLTRNIKCGNSLIEDSSLAGDKAFNWKEEFADVFIRGGFDVVIGNPPYGDYFTEAEKKFLLRKYNSSFSGTVDMYIFFYELALDICANQGRLCFITPNTFIEYHQFSGLRKLLSEYNNVDYVIGLSGAFEDAIVDTVILSLTKDSKQQDTFFGKIFKSKVISLEDEELPSISADNLQSDGFIVKSSEGFDVKKFCSSQPYRLGDIVRITQGITTGGNYCLLGMGGNFRSAGIPDSIIKNSLKGKTINRYRIISDEECILYSVKSTPQITQDIIAEYLLPFKNQLSEQTEIANGSRPWYCLHRPRQEADFNEPKILIRQTADYIIGVFDDQNHYPIDSLHTLNLYPSATSYGNPPDVLRFLLAILNSKLFKYLYKWKLDEDGKVYPQVKKVNVEWLPIPQIENIGSIVNYVKEIQSIHSHQETLSSSFTKYVERTSNLHAVPSVIQHWHEYGFREFITSLSVAVKKCEGRKISKSEEIEWMEVFESKKEEMAKLKEKARQIDRFIDNAVYDAYGLDSKVIALMENL